jgi:hypothetical protein
MAEKARRVSRRQALTALAGLGGVAIGGLGRFGQTRIQNWISPPRRPLEVVYGMATSETLPFLNSPAVQDEFGRNGLLVVPTAAGSRQVPGPPSDFVLSSEPAYGNNSFPLFSTPMAIATFHPLPELLTTIGLTTVDTDGAWSFDVARYLQLVDQGLTWNNVPYNAASTNKSRVLIATADPARSTVTANYVAITAFVRNARSPVSSHDQVTTVVPRLVELFTEQGHLDSSDTELFQSYLHVGIAEFPLVWTGEAQFLAATLNGTTPQQSLLLYPIPNVVTTHTLVAWTPLGRQVGTLLREEPAFAELAAGFGYRTTSTSLGNTPFDQLMARRRITVPRDFIPAQTPLSGVLSDLIDVLSQQVG